MSKMGEELERRLNENKYELWEACRAWEELWNMRPLDSGSDMQEILARCWAQTERVLDKIQEIKYSVDTESSQA